ncbi:extracellular solute-binding protein [Mordavella massiliensis]|uniref:ABC transporter substrate-binding protein n=1 Tax=Mordavella massiliensis TaxID=1871024 RepID=UPI00210A5C23|nr:extracellular solute-binding protein [Mordavella massiliensis]
MKRMTAKRLISASLVTVLSAGLLAGCGSDTSEESSSDGGETTITFGIHVANPEEQETVTYNIVQEFNKQYEGQYKVEFEAADTETHSKNLKLQSTDGTLPDIFWVDAAEAPEYAESGVLMDLSDYLSENTDIDEALNGMEDGYNNGEIQYGLPYQCNVQGFFYNKELFDAAGVEYPTNETTYEEFLDMIAKLKESGVTPIAIGSKNSSYTMWEFNEFLERYGWSENIDAILSGEKKFNNPDLVACFEKMEGLKDAGAFPDNMATIEYFDAKQLFDNGTAAMFGTGQWDCSEFDENLGDKVGFWWGPVFSDSDYEQKVAMKVPAAPIAVNAEVADDDAMKEAVYAFLNFYYSEDAAKMSYEGSIFPATSYEGIAASDTQYAMNAMLEALSEGWTSPESAPDLTVGSAVQTELYNGIFGVLQGTYTPEEALDKMDETLSYE